MQLRNGKRLGEADQAEGSHMDTSSTQAELGSPHHTNSFSTINSASTVPQTSQPGPSTSADGQALPQPNSQTREPGQRLRQSIPHPHGDFILYPTADEEEYADSQAPQEEVPGQDPPHQQPASAPSSSSGPAVSGTRVPENENTPLAFQNNGSGVSSPSHPTPTPLPSDPPRTPTLLDTGGEQQPSAAVQQWGTPPWSILSHAAGAIHELAGEPQYPPDRTYPDKMEEDLEKLHHQATNSDGDAGDEQRNGKKKARKGKRKGTKRRGTRSPPRGPDRQDKRPRGGGDDGNGITA